MAHIASIIFAGGFVAAALLDSPVAAIWCGILAFVFHVTPASRNK